MNSSIPNDLAAALGEYDGRDTKYLKTLADRFAASPDYIDSLIACFDRSPTTIADGATWLLLAHLRSGGGGGDDGDDGGADGEGGEGGEGGEDGGFQVLTRDQIAALVGKVGSLTSWAAQLHICQGGRFVPIDADQALVLAEWLRPLLAAKKPFVRAWSLDAFLHVCSMLPSHAGEGRMALEAALNDPAASVRARARNLG